MNRFMGMLIGMLIAISGLTACAQPTCIAVEPDLSIQELNQRLSDVYDLPAYALAYYSFEYDEAQELIEPSLWFYQAGNERTTQKWISVDPLSRSTRCVETRLDEDGNPIISVAPHALALMTEQFPLIRDRPIDIARKYHHRYPGALWESYDLMFDKDSGRYLWSVTYYFEQSVWYLEVDALSGEVVFEHERIINQSSETDTLSRELMLVFEQDRTVK